ncbi:hypothetical protein CDD81_6469 [Ophiocordyceps australis]|uniref:RRM domain-containing protein n=1 Tax=Ophiocordyceps australis TaxID=1399860 RepID=A0A2C5YH59_9HYPO|nr:hypothetical protein CDD81_6469 [Ophiocordyceps australis]
MAPRSLSPSPPRGRMRSRTRSPSRRSDDSRRRRYRSRSATRSPSPAMRRNGHHGSQSRSRSRSRGYAREGFAPREVPPVMGTKIVVERLSKNVTESHLREIFGYYGPIQDLDLPLNRTFGTNRGTAYILYERREDAEEAIANMHDGQIDGTVINVSIVLPRRMFSPPPPLARRGANIDPRVPFNGSRGGRGGRMRHSPGYDYNGPPRGPGRRYPQSPSRHGPPMDPYPPSTRSRSRSQSPPRGPRPYARGRPPSRSRYSRSPSRSMSPRPRHHNDRYDYAPRRRSRSRNYDYNGDDRRYPVSPGRG